MKKYFLIIILSLITSWAKAELNFSIRMTSGVMKLVSSLDTQKYIESEINVGYRLSQALNLQGAAFTRFTNKKEYWGLQVLTPLTLIVSRHFLSSYFAPGYRYMNDSYSSPILEGGLKFYFLKGFGLGYRFIFNEWVKNGLKTESQFFISISL